MTRRLRFSFRKKDRISHLPDPLLHHILSFLPMKDAAATTLLSKRWKPLFLSQINLRFDDHPFPDYLAFRKFFYSFMNKRDKNLPILSFHLNCCYSFVYTNDFATLVNAAITPRVENLSIGLCQCQYKPALPTWALTSKTLTVLKLKRATLIEQVPNFVDLPSLKLLHLESVNFRCCDGYKYIKKSGSHFLTLVLTSKTLTVLKLKRVSLIEQVPNFVHLPSLKVLHLESVSFSGDHHIQKLLSACPILEDLEAKYLIVARLSMRLRESRKVINLPKLVRAHILDLHIELDWLYNSNNIRIQVIASFDLDCMFHNLTRLELIFDYIIELHIKSKWNGLVKMLQSFPKLQTLIVHEVDIVNNHGDKYWEEPQIVPHCLLSHLTTCSLINYSRINCELPFAKYIMQNSRVLSTMTIHTAQSVETNVKLQMFMELSLCPRVSATCKFLFI